MNVPAISSEQMEKIDREMPEKYGVTVSRMMENAAYQLADFIRQKFSKDEKIVVYAGKGNNGGDGLAAARRLYNWGYNVEVVAPFKLDGIRREELEILWQIGVPVFEEPRNGDVAVDALIGYNLKGDPRPPFDELIETVNSAETVVSADVPSGVDADTGESLNPHVDADYVVTFGLPKKGLQNLDAEVWLADISVPEEAYALIDVEVDGLFEGNSLIRVD